MIQIIDRETDVEPARTLHHAASEVSGKIYCANCIHCKLVPSSPDGDDRYFLRVRCAAGKWHKRLGEEKLYKYCTVIRRSLNSCDAYEEMGEPQEFLKDLRKSLPVKDELYIR
jgi:hypothetical protein